ncbi:hypothetical protein [Mesorhizobium sp. KR1-2]|uniref:hypothetical protein n=1 Tax=Mesorhizobium sp. KR1-2 TaxID=3156609 RepID=UPI0032B4621F
MKPTARIVVPRRIFLDTCAFQVLADCGGFIFDADEFPLPSDFRPGKCPQVVSRPDAREVLEPLRWIFRFDERAHFDWIVSRKLLEEVDAGGDRYRSSYVRDIADHSWACLSDNPPTEYADEVAAYIASPKCGFVSQKDKALLVEAAAAGCDTFLTIEHRLPKVANSLLKQVPLLIATPLWAILKPHVRGL